jgi:hypothetical protein
LFHGLQNRFKASLAFLVVEPARSAKLYGGVHDLDVRSFKC